MQGRRSVILFIAAFALVFTSLTLTAPLFAASKENVLHRFSSDGKDGVYSSAGLIFDAAGNLYGTTPHGGPSDLGTVYQLSPGANGTWTETVLHSFSGNDGLYPDASLIFDAAGNLYGTTYGGGAHNAGAVFQLSPRANGTWTENVLYSFGTKAGDGGGPMASLIFDAAGNLYGTSLGGQYGKGNVFELSPGAGGTWTETVLYSFNGKDGQDPKGSLVFDAAGNLYGTTYSGGGFSVGAVFQLSPGAGGKWTEKVSHRFTGRDGGFPYAGLILDGSGNLYGTTLAGGAYDFGTVFQLTPGAHGTWTEKVVHSFNHNSHDGVVPYAGLIFDKAGNLFGTTFEGGTSGTACSTGFGCGTVFELKPGAKGKWTEKVLYSFVFGKDGLQPFAGVIFDAGGNLYGTTQVGGSGCGSQQHCGTVFEITP